MFDQLVVSGANQTKTNKSWTVLLSSMIQVGIVVVMILVPLIYTEALPKGMLTTFLAAPPPPPPPPPPAAAIKIVKPQVHLIHDGQLKAPTVIPKKVNIIKEEEQPPDVGSAVGGVVGGVAGGSAGGVLGGIIGGTSGSNLPPPPPKVNRPIRIGGAVQSANLIRQVQPTYPQIAKTAHVSGTVILHAIISKDGAIEELTYISGPPLLMKNAMDAVRQWRYRPTMLNGEPVEVDTTISVVFTLGG
jgi:periplasmic protein TonB